MGFDPDTIRISRHALERYGERRHGGGEAGLRRMLGRCADRNPPLFLSRAHGPGRRYTWGQFTFVTDADSQTVITVYKRGNEGARAVDRNRCARQARRKGYRNGH